MKDFLKDLGKVIAETAETVGEKTEEVLEIQKLKSELRTLQRGNKKDYCNLGKMIYNKYKSGEVLDAEYIAVCEAVEQREETIAEYEKELEELRG